MIEQECRKRVFWSAYSLDNYLSAALGRPRRFHEEDIDQQLPSALDDEEITESGIVAIRSDSQSIMAAAVHHAKLSRIVGGILRDLYGIHKISFEKQVQVVQEYSKRLDDWRNEVGGFLDLLDVRLMVVVCQRQHTVLNLAYSHAMVLLHRSTLLRQGARAKFGTTNQSSSNHAHAKASIGKCLQAARKIVSVLRDLTERSQMFQAFWFTQYYAFSALVVLYVHVIQNSDDASSDVRDHLTAAQQGLQDLSSCASENSYVQRNVVVLRELQDGALKAVSRNAAPVSATLQLPDTTQSFTVPVEVPLMSTRTNNATDGGWNYNTTSQQPEMPGNNANNAREERSVVGDMSSNVGLAEFDPNLLQSTDLFASVGLGELDILFSVDNEGLFEMENFGLYQ